MENPLRSTRWLCKFGSQSASLAYCLLGGDSQEPWLAFCLVWDRLPGMALLLPLTYTLEPSQAIILLCGIFYGNTVMECPFLQY